MPCIDLVRTALYTSYFAHSQHPSSSATLTRALLAAGVDAASAQSLVDDESENAMETKMAIREQAGNGVDSVPYVVFEGRRRDFTVVGAKDEDDYEKVLQGVRKEV